MMRLLLLSISTSCALQVPAAASRHARVHCSTTEEIAVPWEDVKATLDDSVPVFVVTDQESRPLAASTVMCYTDSAAALVELTRASDEFPGLNLKLQPVGLGTVLERARLGRCRLLPSEQDLEVARAANPEGEDWGSGAVPLFGCRQLQRQRKGGVLATPLWLSVEDAKAALREADPERTKDLELTCTSLQRIVSLQIAGEVGPMDFVPSRAVVKYMQRSAAVEGEGDEATPGVTRGMIARSLPDWMKEDQDDKYGLFG